MSETDSSLRTQLTTFTEENNWRSGLHHMPANQALRGRGMRAARLSTQLVPSEDCTVSPCHQKEEKKKKKEVREEGKEGGRGEERREEEEKGGREEGGERREGEGKEEKGRGERRGERKGRERKREEGTGKGEQERGGRDLKKSAWRQNTSPACSRPWVPPLENKHVETPRID